MRSAVVMPKVGLTMTEGRILEWKKGIGDRVEQGETIFVFETEKVTFEVEAPQTGYLAEIVAAEGETVAVGADVAVLHVSAHGSAARVQPASGHSHMQGSGAVAGAAELPVATATRDRVLGAPSAKVRATPLARRIARDNGLDLARVVAACGSARLKRKDVESFLAARAASAPTVPETVAAPGSPQGRLVQLTSMRKAIARKVLASTVEAAQAYMVISVDARKLVEARQRLLPVIERQTKIRMTLTDLLTKLVAVAISRHPVLNTNWTPEGIVWQHGVHIGIATALEDGLVVPVIPDVATKQLSAIVVERHALIEGARAGNLAPERMMGGTFTISSLGMFGVEEFSAIINQPESAILAVGAIIDTPVARDGAVVIRPVMKLTLTYDHRIIDGAKAAAFVATLKEVVEEPFLALA